MDTKKLLAISKKARQERKQEKEKRRQEKLQAVENEEEIVEEMLKNQPIKVKEKQETGSASEENDGQIEKAQDRLEVLKKIEEFEREGKFDVDVEEDPPTIVLTPENIDYLREKMSSKIKRIFANEMGERFLDNLLKNNKLIIKQVNGIENLNKVKTGALITCNHFNPFDCFTVEKVFRMSENEKDKRLYKVIREGNYTNFPGLYGFFFRNCDTLPLSSNKRTMVNFMKAVDTILQKGDYILIYPEQSMWWNYRKPKPLKNGAFKLAARNNVPVIPIFITMEDSKLIGEDGFNIQEYTINVEEPIYPDEKLTEKENTEIMKQKNFETWKNVYEKFYGIPLEYTCGGSDELNDELAPATIQSRVIDEKFKYKKCLIWNVCSLFIQNVLSMPIKWGYLRIKFRHKFVGKEKLKECKKQGYFMYANHTQPFADTFIPSVADYPKRNFLIVNPVNISLKGTRTLVEMLGAIPIPSDIKAMKNFLATIEEKIKNKNSITIYPEAHIWPYYTKIRPFKAVSFKYPVKLNAPTYCITNTYQSYGRHNNKIQLVSYVDGPFYPNEELPLKERQQDLRDRVYEKMVERSKNNNVEHIKYVKIEKNEEKK